MGKKVWLVIAISLILVGCVIFGGVMTVLKWDFTKLSTVKYETNEYAIGEGYRNLVIITDTADIVLVPADGTESLVTCYEQRNMTHRVSVQDDTLVIELTDTRKWAEHIGINFSMPKITLAIPSGEYGTLSIKSDTGDVELHEDFAFESVDIAVSTGDVINHASTSGMTGIKTSTGDIRVESISAGNLNLAVSTGKVTGESVACQGDVMVGVSTGKTKLTNIQCKNVVSKGGTGDITLESVIAQEGIYIERTTGDVNFEASDAAEISVLTSTGDVGGRLLSDKVFITKTDTGSVDVPATVTGGRCQITTDTGDIHITVN